MPYVKAQSVWWACALGHDNTARCTRTDSVEAYTVATTSRTRGERHQRLHFANPRCHHTCIRGPVAQYGPALLLIPLRTSQPCLSCPSPVAPNRQHAVSNDSACDDPRPRSSADPYTCHVVQVPWRRVRLVQDMQSTVPVHNQASYPQRYPAQAIQLPPKPLPLACQAAVR